MPTAEKNRPSSKRPPDAFLRYTGMATQMVVVIVVGLLAGRWLDSHFGTAKPWFTGLITVISVFLSMYLAVKDLLRK